ncbi:unnamed protein product [Rotaria sp. Silwood2]|nr:unnamed protein product [Rotaria sp. Silwood2]
MTDKRVNTIVAVEPSAVMAAFTPTEEDSRQAMLVFLKNLPVDCYFNIIHFGTQYKSLLREITTIYNEENSQKAEQLITKMKVDLGGTELMGPLQWIEQHSPNQGRARQIFLPTDGEISNVTAVLDSCRSMASSTRIFSFGLGKPPSQSLVKGLARSTNGRFVFVPPNSKLQIGPNHRPLAVAKVNQIPSVVDNKIIARLAAKALILELQHAKLPSSTANKRKTGSIQARFQNMIASDEEKMEVMPDEQATKQRIIELSLKYNILSPYTAFIGIEKRTNTSNADMILREVPIEISADDQHLFTPSRLHFLGGGAVHHSAGI